MGRRIKPCQHVSTCEVSRSDQKCCSCSDDSYRHPPYPPPPNLKETRLAKYCPGCFKRLEEKEEERRKFEQKQFLLWQRYPLRYPSITKLAINFYLRKIPLQFELAHVVLAFLMEDPPIPWFRSMGLAARDRGDVEQDDIAPGALVRPGFVPTKAQKQKISDEVYQFITRREAVKARARGVTIPVCSHDWCNMQNKTLFAEAHACCACSDMRDPETKDQSLEIEPVKGYYYIKHGVPFYHRYCPGCVAYYMKHPTAVVVSLHSTTS